MGNFRLKSQHLSHRLFLILALLIAATGFTTAQGDPVWQPSPGTTWQWQLQGAINTSFNVEMYDIDLFEAPQATIDLLHSQDRIVICYFSAGSYEDFRPDADDFPPEVLGEPLDEWPGERWLDISQIELLAPIMEARLDLAVSKQCDGVEPDNMDGYTNETGFELTGEDQLAYNVWLAAESHERNLSVGLKNDLDQITELVDDFDWALNEQCFQYNECDLLLPFIEAGKAVFGVEYKRLPEVYCAEAVANHFSWLHKTFALNDQPPDPCSRYVAPTRPKLLTPEKGALLIDKSPTMIWRGYNATQYRLIVKKGKVASTAKTVLNVKKSQPVLCDGSDCLMSLVDLSKTLKAGNYLWRVVAINPVNTRQTVWWAFSVQP